MNPHPDMLKSLASMLLRKPAQPPPAPAAEAAMPCVGIKDEHAPIYESLAMTEEMREALFPTTPRMVSAIFDRSASAGEPPPATMQRTLLAHDGRGFPLV